MNQNKSLDSLLEQGHHQLERGQYEAGLEVFRQADNLFLNNPEVKYGLGLAYYRLEQYQKCIDSLNLAFQLQPIYPLALVRRGIAYKALEQNEHANTDFEKVLEIEPKTHEDWRARGIAFDELKQSESALECHGRALEVEPSDHRSWQNKGLTLKDLQRWDKALECFDKALEIFPDKFFSIRSRGDALFFLQRYQEALDSYNQALELKPQDFFSLTWRGLCLASLGKSQEAIASYDAALEIKPDNFVAWYFKGNALVKLQRYESALSCYDKALEINPEFKSALQAKDQLLLEVDNSRHRAYLQLIRELLQCHNGEENQILNANRELIDADLIVIMKQVAGEFDRQGHNKGKWLRSLAQNMADYLNNSRPDAHFNLLLEILHTFGTGGDREEIYTLLKQNLPLVDINLASALQSWFYNELLKLDLESQFALASAIGIFSSFVREFSWGKRAINIEIAITGHKLISTIFTEADYPVDWARNKSNLGNAYGERIEGDRKENLEQAIAAFSAALRVYTENKFPKEWAITQNNLGIAYCDRIEGDRRGNLEQAIAAYEANLQVCTENNFPEEWATTQSNLGNVYHKRIAGDRSKNLEQAIAHHKATLRIYTEKDFPQQWAGTQNNIGNVFRERIAGARKENLEQAIAYYKAALRVCNETDFSQQWVTTQGNLGVAYHHRIVGDKKNNIEQAIDYYEATLRVCNETDFPQQWITTQGNLGTAYHDRIVGKKEDNIEQAIDYYEAILRVCNETDFPQQWAATQNNLGISYRDRIAGQIRDNFEFAIVCFQNALSIFTPQADPLECLNTARNLGNLALDQKQWKLAINAYATAIEAVEISRYSASSEARKQEILSDAISVYVNMARACIQDGQYVRAIEYLERSKTRNLVDLLTERQMYPKGEFPQQIIDSLDALRRNLIAAERRLQQQKTEECFNRLTSLRQSMEYLLRNHIQPVDPSFQLSQRVELISFGQIQAALPTPQTALIEWCVSKDTFTTFIVTKNRTQPLVITKNFEEVQTLTEIKDKYLSKYREYKEKWQERLILFLYQLARTLEWDEVIESLKQVLPDCNRIILVPHRWLHIIPIHALPLKDGRCLLDLFPQGVSYAPSVQLLELTQQEVWGNTGDKEDRKDKEEKNFFAVQNPTEDPDLPYTSVEVAAIRKQFQPQDDVLVGKEGHRQALTTERLGKANYTHFSCHGTFNFEKPERSALLLADSVVEMEAEGDKEDKGDKTRYLPSRDGSYIDLEKCLTLGEIFGLDLRSCRLVTLSACETGLTDIKNLSDEYIGLPSGFLYAGSPSVVSSLWAVSDLSTTFLMIKFYQNLREMDSVAIALNQAQLWLRNVTKEELVQWKTSLDIPGAQKFRIDSALRSMPDNSYPFAAPSHWAAFCAIGS
ncbi:MAG: CHAT domain-containing tetratricopeptide repeat protein [Cyanobacteria bacterium P01_A01_bin.83]